MQVLSQQKLKKLQMLIVILLDKFAQNLILSVCFYCFVCLNYFIN